MPLLKEEIRQILIDRLQPDPEWIEDLNYIADELTQLMFEKYMGFIAEIVAKALMLPVEKETDE